MNQDQIKAIAEEYAKWFMTHKASESAREELPNSLTNEVVEMIASDAEDMYRWLNEHYCIVEREKVIDRYKFNKMCVKSHKDPSREYFKGAVDVLNDLFGTSMFNQNEE